MTIRIRPRAAGITLCGALVAASAACGGGDSVSAADRDGITSTAVAVAQTHDGNTERTCQDLLTPGFVTTFFGTQKICTEPGGTEQKDAATGAAVTEIEVDGDVATALVAHQGGESDGATGRWRFARDGAGWRVADWEVDFLRSYFAAAFGPGYEADGADDPLAEPKVRTCLVDTFSQREDGAFVTLMHDIFKQTKGAEKLISTTMFDCLEKVDLGGVSALRELFESGLTEGAAEDGGPAAARVGACVAKELRTSVSDAEIRDATEQYLDKGGDASDYYSGRMIRSVQAAFQTCAAASSA